jgi:hypothetical protein
VARGAGERAFLDLVLGSNARIIISNSNGRNALELP